MPDDLGSSTRKGTFWTFLFDGFELVLTLAGTMVLARLLLPVDFGLIGLTAIATQFAQRLAQMGFGAVIVQKKDLKPEHLNAVNLLNMLTMSTLCLSLFLAAPMIAEFFENERLELIVKVISFDFVLRAFSAIPQALLKRKMHFKQLGLSETLGKVSTIVCSVIMALMGAGVWSLVVGNMLGSLVYRSSVIRFAYKRNEWRPGFSMTRQGFREVFDFGIWIYASTMVNYAIDKIDYLVIGKFLGATQLGFYERAFNLMSFPRKQIANKLNAIMFSTYSKIQDNDGRMVRGMLRLVSYISIIAYPLMIWFFFVAPSMIMIMYGPRWGMVVLPLQIMCISGIVDTFTQLFQPLLRAKGKSDIHARADFLYLLILAAAVFISVEWGIAGVATGIATTSIFRLSFMLRAAKKVLPLTVGAFLKAQRSAHIYGGIMLLALFFVDLAAAEFITRDSWMMFALLTILAPVVYFGSHLILRFKDVNEFLEEIWSGLRSTLNRTPLTKIISKFTRKR